MAVERKHPIRNAVLAGVGFLLLGLAGWTYLPDSRIAMPIAVCAIIPFGKHAGSMRKGLFRGVILGLLAGLGMFTGFYRIASDSVVVSEGAHEVVQSASQPEAVAQVVREQETAELRANVARELPMVFVRTVVGTSLLCGAVGAFFGYLARRRKTRATRPWK